MWCFCLAQAAAVSPSLSLIEASARAANNSSHVSRSPTSAANMSGVAPSALRTSQTPSPRRPVRHLTILCNKSRHSGLAGSGLQQPQSTAEARMLSSSAPCDDDAAGASPPSLEFWADRAVPAECTAQCRADQPVSPKCLMSALLHKDSVAPMLPNSKAPINDSAARLASSGLTAPSGAPASKASTSGWPSPASPFSQQEPEQEPNWHKLLRKPADATRRSPLPPSPGTGGALPSPPPSWAVPPKLLRARASRAAAAPSSSCARYRSTSSEASSTPPGFATAAMARRRRGLRAGKTRKATLGQCVPAEP
mmetsp:Transcript_28822/g.73112  ORF Transcript_28822/g.73112 Transcript_28822/m.73112 type:complete len:309 (+) Transcript_28822:98-1024(+)